MYEVLQSRENSENTISFLFPLGSVRVTIERTTVGKPSIFPLGVILTPYATVVYYLCCTRREGST